MKNMHKFKKHIPCVAFASISLVYIYAGINKIMNFKMMAGVMEAKGYPYGEVWIVLAIIMLIGGGLLILTKKKACMGACVLGVFLIVATLMFHTGKGELLNFLKNLSLLGGLMLVKYVSCTSCCSSKKDESKEDEKCCKSSGGCC